MVYMDGDGDGDGDGNVYQIDGEYMVISDVSSFCGSRFAFCVLPFFFLFPFFLVLLLLLDYNLTYPVTYSCCLLLTCGASVRTKRNGTELCEFILWLDLLIPLDGWGGIDMVGGMIKRSDGWVDE